MNQPYPYFYGNEAEQYTFYRLPKVLFTNEHFKNLSDSAKILYGLMLDRMSLSIKNGWLDEQERVFIIFTLEDVQEYLNCKHDKGVKLLAELDTEKGVGLIERIKRGQGKPALIYLRKFVDTPEVRTSEKPKSGQPDFPNDRLLKNRNQDSEKTDTNKNDKNNTDFSDTEYNDTESIPILSHHSLSAHESGERPKTGTDRSGTETACISAFEAYRDIIRDNIGYDGLIERFPYEKEQINEIADLIVETVCTTRKAIRIAGDDYPAEIVKAKFMKLHSGHLEYVRECMKKNTADIRNIKKYLLAVLFNAPTTISSYYTSLVAHDMAYGLLFFNGDDNGDGDNTDRYGDGGDIDDSGSGGG